MSKPALPPGIGMGRPVHPFAVTVEDQIPKINALVPDGYGIKYHAYHTITEGVFLPAGTSLPGGAVLPMSSVADFPMVLPQGSKLPGGVMVPITMQKKPAKGSAAAAALEPVCSIQ